MMVYRTPSILPLLYPQLVWRMPADRKELYLTFDDGPVPGPTEFVLDELNKHNIQATFFCIGDNIRKHPHIFKKVVAAGHAVGNHTFNHLKGWQTDTQTYVDNVNACDREIATNHHPAGHLFRPPYGRITRKQIMSIRNKKIIMWDVLTQDYDATVSAGTCLSSSLKAIRNGSIIVFHDSSKAEKNLMHVLPIFIERCLEQGYIFKRLE